MPPSLSESDIDETKRNDLNAAASILMPSQRDNLRSSGSLDSTTEVSPIKRPRSQRERSVSNPVLRVKETVDLSPEASPAVPKKKRKRSRGRPSKLDKLKEGDGVLLKISSDDVGKYKLKKCRFPRLTSIAFLGEVADSFENSVNNHESRARLLKKKYPWTESEDEKPWFYRPRGPEDVEAALNEDGSPSSTPVEYEGEFYPTEKMMPNATAAEIVRIDHYRDLFKWEKRHLNYAKRKIEYILDYKRKHRQDLYLVKWCGIPELGSTWVRPIDISTHRYEFGRQINQFWEAAKKIIPHKKMPIVRRSNYEIPPEYSNMILVDYVKEKREKMKEILAENPLGENLIIENELDISKSPFSFDFIKQNTFIGDKSQLTEYAKELEEQLEIAEAMGHFCKEECGECTVKFYQQNDLGIHKASWKKYKHYRHVTAEEGGGHEYWKVVHPESYLIFECTDNCICRKNGTCKMDQLSKLRANVNTTKFSIFKTDNDRGWGLKAMQRFKQGEAVIEYVGELMLEDTFKLAENQIWGKGLMYSMNLTQNDKNFPAYVVDSSRKGNHSRLINHSCDPNLTTYKIIKDDRNINRPCPVLFANKDIEPGEELTFNYKIEVQNQDEDPSNENGSSEGVADEQEKEDEFEIVFTCQCGSKKCKDRDKSKKTKKPAKQLQKKRKLEHSSKPSPKKPKTDAESS